MRRSFACFLFLMLALPALAVDDFVFRQEFGPVQTRGAAVLTDLPGGGLIVSNIRTGGGDGARMDVGRSHDGIGPVRWMAPESLDGRRLSIVVEGETATGEVIRCGIEQGFGNDLDQNQVSFNPMATGVTAVVVTAYRHGNPLYEGQTQVGTNPLYESSAPPTGGGAGLPEGAAQFVLPGDLAFLYPDGTAITLPGLVEPVVADMVTVTIAERPFQRTCLTALEVLGDEPQGSTGSLTIRDWPALIGAHPMTALGDAVLAGTGEPGPDDEDVVQVTGVGSSGEDGVTVDVNPGDTGLGVDLAFPLPPAVGETLALACGTWQAQDGSAAALPALRMAFQGDRTVMRTDLGGPVPVRIDYLLGGEIVFGTPNVQTQMSFFTSVQHPFQLAASRPDDSTMTMTVSWAQPFTVTDDTGIDQDCDGIALTYAGGGTAFYRFDNLEVRGRATAGGRFWVTAVPNAVSGPAWTGWTSATGLGASLALSDDGSRLLVGGLPAWDPTAEPTEGVAIDLIPAPGVQSALAAKCCRGHVTVLKHHGTYHGGGGGGGVIVVAMGFDGDATQVGADMSDVGAADLRYDFYDDGNLVATEVRGNGDTCFSSDGIPSATRAYVRGNDGTPVLELALPVNSLCTPVGAQASLPVQADQVLITAQGPAVDAPDDWERISILASGGGVLDVWGIEVLDLSDAPHASPRAAARLDAVSPNPFNPRTAVAFQVLRPGRVELGVFDLKGRLVRRLLDARLDPGPVTAVWDGRTDAGAAASSGAYLMRLRSAGAVESRAVTLVR